METHAVGSGADRILGISFGDAFRAQEFLSAVSRLNARGELRLVDAVMVTKDPNGRTRVTETVDLQPGRAALSGAVWTGLLGLIIGGPVGWVAGIGMGAGAGVLAAKVVDVGIPDEWVAWFRAAVEPDTYTVVILAAEVHVDALVAEARRFDGAHLVHSTMDIYAIRRLQIALGEAEVDTPREGGPEQASDHSAPWPPPSH